MSNEKIIEKVEEINKDGKPYLQFSYADGTKEPYPIRYGESSGDIANRYVDNKRVNRKYILIEKQSQIDKRFKAGNFENCIFLMDTNFISVRFTEIADFTQAIFKKEADFEEARFMEIANFEGTIFSQKANFGYTMFEKKARFKGTIFSQEANFTGATFTQKTNFLRVKFEGEVNFPLAIFEDESYFSQAKFTQKADFLKARFMETANFNQATFEEEATFSYAIFEKGANFFLVTFEEETYFYLATFTQVANFAEIKVKKSTNFYFHLARFSDALLLNNITSTDPITINLKQATIENISYGDAQFRADNRETFLTLKNIALKQHDHIRALEFHRQEYEQHLKDEKLKWWHSEKIILEFERCVSNFGTSIWRPSFWLFSISMFFYFTISFLAPNSTDWFSTDWFFIVPTIYDVTKIIEPTTASDDIAIVKVLFLLYKILQLVLIYEIIKSFRKFSRNL